MNPFADLIPKKNTAQTNSQPSSSNPFSDLIGQQQEPKPSAFTSGPVGSLPVVKQLNQFGVGLGTEIGKAGIGLGQTFLKGAQYASNKVLGTPAHVYDENIKQLENIKQNVYEKPFQTEKSSLSGKVGTLAGAAVPFIATTPAVTAGQEFLQGATKADKILGSTRVVPYLVEKFAQVAPEAVVSGGTEYAVSGGDKKKAIQTGAAAGFVSLLTHVGADAYRQLIPQDVKTNVLKSLGIRGKTSLNDVAVGKKATDGVEAYTTISRMAPDIQVVDKNGITKTFDPTHADYIELPQALQQSKDKIYKAYTNLATQAGDKGASFSPDDFQAVIDDLKKYEGKGYTQAYSNKANQVIEALHRFGTPTKTGVEFSPTNFNEVQKLIESINTDVNPLSDKAGAKVALEASSKIREILDDKITGATGEGYQQLRTAYSQLKSIEGDVINNYKKALRQQGVAGDIIDGISTVDAIQGILTGEKNLSLRGALIQGVKKGVNYIRDPEVAMQRAFKLINQGESGAPTTLGARLTGPISETSGAFKAGQATQDVVKRAAKDQGGFIKVPFGGADTVSGVSPTSVAKNIGEGDLKVIRTFLEAKSPTAYIKAQPMLEAMGIGKLSVPNQERFLNEVLDLSTKKIPVKSLSASAPTFTKGAAGRFTGSTGGASKAIQNHLTSAKQIVSNLQKSELETMGGMKELLQRTQVNIVDGIKSKYPEVSKAISNIDISKFKSIKEFEAVIKKLLAK